MKTTIASVIIAILGSLGFASNAEAHSYPSRVYISGYQRCGAPIYKERYFVGYDRHGRPVFATRVVRYAAPRYVARPCYGSGFTFRASYCR